MNGKEAEEILKDLVTIPSDSADPKEDMASILSYAREFLKKLGCTLTIGGEEKRPALLARCGDNAERGVLFSGHLDTVPAGSGWSKEQGAIEDGVLYGRGSADMKGGCAAILLAASRLAAEKIPFSILFTTDEETTMKGAEAMAPYVRKNRAVVIAEPTDFDVVFREKGVYQFSVTTKGKSAHASLPWLGENAVEKMAAVITALKQEPVSEKDVAERLTISPNVVSGGSKVNVIPASAKLEVDSRFPPGMTKGDVRREVEARMANAGMTTGDYEIKEIHHLPPAEVDPKKEEIRTMVKMAGGKLIGVPYATEMVMFRPYNDRVMVCGPGEPREAHVTDEKIRIADVERAARIYFEYANHSTL